MKLGNLVAELALVWAAGPAAAGEAAKAVEEGVTASGHASASVAHAIGASGQVTSAAMAVPLGVSGAVATSAGTASTAAAGDSMRAATRPIGAPLEITDESVTAMPPPNEALKKKPGI